MAKLNITQAAREWGIARSTLQRAVKRGDVAVTTDENGLKSIDSSEMIRAYGAASGRSAVNLGVAGDSAATELESQLQVEKLHHKYLKSENDLLKREVDRLDTIVSNQREMLTAFFKRLPPPKRK